MNAIDSSINSLVCDACWNGIFSAEGWQAVLSAKHVSDDVKFSEGYVYKTTWATLHAAADGCGWCRFLVKGRKTYEGELQVRVACEDSDCTPAGGKKLKLVVHGRDGGLMVFLHYFMYTNSDDKAAGYVAARDRITDISTPESYTLALECLQNCLLTHKMCPQPQPDTTLLPDRVIDCSNTRKPKIVLTNGKQYGLYVALTYVWGGPQPMTTTNNIAEYVNEGLDMSQFPQTIRDAVVTTHNLGQRYLWIDALCILQDSDQDKAKQLGMMRRIYRDAYLTINAACASSSREGFLHRPRPKKVPDARIPYRCPDGTIGTVYIARERDTDAGDASRSYWDELEPVTSRAWCLQERLLPPRSLLYASDTLKFSCQTETVNIGGALCEPSTGRRLPNLLYRTQRSSESAPPSAEEEEADRVACRQAWLAMIFMYTMRDLTVPSDKLLALAGVAEQFHIFNGDQYLAGLWRRSLLLDLLWEHELFGKLPPRPERYRAPSWSWASTDGIISTKYLEKKLRSKGLCVCQAEILECKVELACRDLPFGEVIGGILRLKGVMKQVVVKRSSRAGDAVLSKGLDGEMVKFGYVKFDAKEERPEEMYVIPLLWDGLGSFVMGIAAVSASGSQYKRIGKFENSSGSTDVAWLNGLDKREIVLV